MRNPPARQLDPTEERYLYEQFLRCIDREENLIHYRLTWGLQWNSALFIASFAVIQWKWSIFAQVSLFLIMAIIGVGISGLSMIGVSAARTQAEYLINDLKRRLRIVHDHDWADSDFLRPFGQQDTIHKKARLISTFIPMLTIIIWIVLSLYLYTQLVSK